MVIDAHHHFWKYTPDEYGWIDDDMALLRRDFLAPELGAELAATGVDGAISVQARQSLEETQWLLEIAAEHPFIQGVVGWVPLADDRIEAVLETFAGSKKLKSVRHVLQGEADSYMLGEGFNRGIDLLDGFGLAYDILIVERQLAAAIELVDRHPGQFFILDHIAKPQIGKKLMEPWRAHIQSLAERQNVYCKFSGVATEDDWRTWSRASIQPYFDTVLEAFGPGRLMYGSDWPVCKVASSYSRWNQTVRELIADLSADEQAWILGRTAEHAYKLELQQGE